jgi:hypothetical protein
MAAPINFLQNIFNDIYGIPKVPLFIEASNIRNTSSQASYHSLTLPVLTDFLPKYRQSTNMTDIIELYDILQKLFATIKDRDIDGSIYPIINSWMESIKYEFFHVSENSGHKFLLPSEDLLNMDSDIKYNVDKFHDLEFSNIDTFFRGCVRMTVK